MSVEVLQARIELDASPFRKGMDDAVSTATRGSAVLALQAAGIKVGYAAAGKEAAGSLAQIGNASAGAGNQVDGLTSKFSGLSSPIQKVVAGLQAFEAARTVVAQFSAAIEDVEVRMKRLNAIAGASRDTGVSASFFTTLLGQAKDLGVQTDTLTGLLDKAREASRVRIGEGKDGVTESAVQARLRQNVMAGNLAQEDLAPYAAARTGEDQIRAILDLMDKLKAAQRDVAAYDLGRTFFGADFEAKLRNGIDLAGALRKSLSRESIAGNSLAPTDEEIARAQDMAAKENEILKVIRDAIAPAVHDFNYLSDAGYQTWLSWEQSVAGWAKWIGEGYLKVRDLAATVRQMATDWGIISGSSTQQEDAPLTIRVKPKPKVDKSNVLPSLSTGRAAKDPIDPDSVANLIRQLEKARDVAQAELMTVGLTNLARTRAVDLAKAEAAARSDFEKGNRDSPALTVEEIARVRAAATATAEFVDRQKDLEQRLHQNAEAARYFGNALADSFADAILEGKSFGDILTSLEKQLARAAIQAAFTGQGPLAGILGLAPAASAGPNALGGLLGTASSGLGSAFGGLNLGSAVGFDPFPHYASGVTSLGMIQGPGSGTSDSILARVSNGESIVTARATQRYRPLIEAMNAGRLPGYAAGVVGAGYDSMAAAGSAMMAQASSAAQGAKTEPGGLSVVINNTQSDKVEAVPRRGPDGTAMIDIVEKAIAGRINQRRSPIAKALNGPLAG